jgi:DNA-binding response OmpR family regulator
MKYLEYGLYGKGPVHSPATSELPPPARISEPPKTLLVVDDEPMVRDVLTQVLSVEGYKVLPADGAAEALRLAREAAAIHLLITDLTMPEIDGFELTRQFRTVHPETPVLMVSGSFQFLHVEIKPDLGRFDYLAKPFHPDELLHKVRTLLDAAAPFPIRKPQSAR